MADKSKIEWTESTWQVTRGCSVVSPGCTNCYAMRQAYRLANNFGNAKYSGLTIGSNAGPVWNGQVRLVSDDELMVPARWKRPRMIFVDSMSDLFHPSVPDSHIDKVFAVMGIARQHTYQVLTKRIDRAREYLTERWQLAHAQTIAGLELKAETAGEDRETQVRIAAEPFLEKLGLVDSANETLWTRAGDCKATAWKWPLPNVWLGTSVEDQKRADERLPHLLASPAAVRFISAEPLLGGINLRLPGVRDPNAVSIDWVIAGGESQDGARPMHPLWARSLREQCKAASVPFFFKQWGAWSPSLTLPLTERQHHGEPGTIGGVHGNEARAYIAGHQYIEMRRVGKSNSGALLDGREWKEWPRAI